MNRTYEPKAKESLKLAKVFLPILIFFLSMAPSCQSTTTNTVLKIEGDLGALTTLGDIGSFSMPVLASAKSDQTGEIALEFTLISIAQIEFKTPDENEDDQGEIEFEGPYVIDLLHGEGKTLPDACITNPIDTSSVQGGVYDEIELSMDRAEGIDPECPVSDQSVYMTGIVVCNGIEIPFTYQDDFEEDLQIGGEGTFVIEEDLYSEILLVFHLEQWFTDVDLCLATPTDGRILLDHQHNTEMASQIRDNIKASADAGEDLDGDGDLDEEESIE